MARYAHTVTLINEAKSRANAEMALFASLTRPWYSDVSVTTEELPDEADLGPKEGEDG